MIKSLDWNKIFYFIWIIAVLIFIYLTSLYGFLLFHTIVELVSMVVAFSIFAVAWNTKQYIKNSYLFFIGISFLFIGIFDMLHTISYKGMNIISGYDTDLPTQLWIVARYMQSITFLAAPFFINKNRKVNINLTIIIYSIISFILLYLVFNNLFPHCFIEGKGLTLFKILSEFIISFIFLVTLIILIYFKKYFENSIFWQIFAGIIFTIIAEITFTLYKTTYGIYNLIGHFGKLIAYYFFYNAIVKDGIINPFDLIFRELKINEEKLLSLSITDELTGLYNRRAFFDILKKLIHSAKRENKLLTLCMLDIDNFKDINDKYGHLKGDKALRIISRGLKSLARESDYACRIGGDEFVLLLPGCSLPDAEKIILRLKSYCSETVKKEKIKYKIVFSYGFSQYNGQDEIDIKGFLEKADRIMYENKLKNKQSLTSS
ncbi:MAG: GGDEF domain-containing protein [Spirochaetes bacterium]|nr:GGDEF domain-containing protein [Spirochaetota bacterium]